MLALAFRQKSLKPFKLFPLRSDAGVDRARPEPLERQEPVQHLLCGLRLRETGGLVFKAHRWLYHSTLGSRVIKKKKRYFIAEQPAPAPHLARPEGRAG